MFYLKVFALLMGIAIWGACSKKGFEPDMKPSLDGKKSRVIWTDAQKQDAKNKFAASLAKVLVHKNVRDLLKTETLKEVTSENEILYASLKDMTIPIGNSVAAYEEGQRYNTGSIEFNVRQR